MSAETASESTARRVLVVEDEVFINSLLVQALNQAGFEAQGVSSAVEAKRAVARFDPDAMIVDIELGDGPSGLELIASLSRSNPGLAFVVLSSFRPTAADLNDLKDIAYLSKKEVVDSQVLVKTLDSALKGVLSDEAKSLKSSPLSVLTKLQLETLKLIAQGHSNSEIAKLRKSTVRAVELLVSRIYDALGLSNEDSHGSQRVKAARIYIKEAGLPTEGERA
jgi:DNA-binding NarL/FixJ family response regulator